MIDLPPMEISPWVTGFFALIAAIAAGWFGWHNYRLRQKNPLPPTWPEIWDRLDRQEVRLEQQEEKIDVLISVIHTVADQWPSGHAKPRFKKDQVRVLNGSMPEKWRTF